MEYSEQVVSVDDIEVPSILYKYRSWNNSYHKTILSMREVFLAPPSSFEDEKDCRVYRKFDYTDEEMFLIYCKMIKKWEPHLTAMEVSYRAIEGVQSAVYRNNEKFAREFQDSEYQQTDKMTGILSLTDCSNKFQMWSHYGNNGDGFCVGLDGKLVTTSIRTYSKVNYCDTLPELIIGEPYGIQSWKQTFNKETKWSFEDEHRFMIFNRRGLRKDERVVKLPIACFKEVVFGWNLSQADRNEIVNVCKESSLSVSYFETKLEGDTIVTQPWFG